MDKNKKLCELLGICWHEWDWDGDRYVCSKCNKRLGDHTSPTVPDFASDAGKVQLLREMRKRKDWRKFCLVIGDFGLEDWPLMQIDYILDTTGLLADRCIEFLEGRKI